GGSDEVGESVELVAHATGVVPGFAEFASTADVRDGVGDTAVEQAETVRIETDGHGGAVAPVAVEEKRGGAIMGRVLAGDEGDRELCAVGGGGGEALVYV